MYARGVVMAIEIQNVAFNVKYVQVGKYVYSKKRLGTLRRNRCENVLKSKSHKKEKFN